MRDRSWLVAVVVVLELATAARAQDGEPSEEAEVPSRPGVERSVVAGVDVVIGLGGTSPTDARLVTSSGRVLARGADGTGWVLLSAGGVGTPLVQARSFAAAGLWASGATPPAFRFSGVTWGAVPVRRTGAARLATCAAPAFASGRRVFVHDGKKWRELRRVGGTAALASLCVVDTTHAAALLDDGSVQVLQGGAWKPLVLAARVTWLGGASTMLVASESGELYRLDAGKPVRLPSDAPLAPRAAAASGKHTWLLIEGAILRLEGRKLARFDALPAQLGAHEWLGLLASEDGTLLVAARDGTVALRSASGTWTQEVANVKAEETTTRAANPPARVGP